MPTRVSAVDRASWLAELADALEQAQRLIWCIGLSAGGNAEAMELYGRLETARMEARALRLGSSEPAPRGFDPNWTDLPPWPVNDER